MPEKTTPQTDKKARTEPANTAPRLLQDDLDEAARGYSPVGEICNRLLQAMNSLSGVPDQIHGSIAQSITDILAAHAAIEAEIEASKGLITALKRDLRKTKGSLAKLREMHFGQSSERVAPELLTDMFEDHFEDYEGLVDDADQAKGRRARTVPTDIPITTVDHFPKNRTCRGCGSEMPSIGSETTTRTILVPEHVKIVKEVYHRCACNKERCKDHGPVAAKSEHFIMRGRTLSAGLVVEAAIQKYHEHSTPYRMERRLSAQNLNISRSTLYRNIAHLAGFLRPVADLIFSEIRECEVAFMDETPIRVQPVQKSAKGKCDLGYLWAIGNDERNWNDHAKPMVYFQYAPTRSGSVAHEMLDNSAVRYLQTDGYSGYNALFDTKRGNDVIISVRCMAHARRKFMDALKQQGSPLAQRVVRKIGSLYKIEKDIIGKPQEVRTAIRQEKALPILLSIQSELLHHQSDAHGQISTAIQYTLKAFDALCKYAFDGRLAIDSNTIERSIRPVALTKKNSLFAGSHEAAKIWATYFTLIETCQLNRVNPRSYLNWAVEEIERCRGDIDHTRLMPWHCPSGHFIK